MGMRRWAWILVVPVLVVLAGAEDKTPEEKPSKGDEAAVREVMNLYFTGFAKADFEMLGRAFHPDCDFFRLGKDGAVEKLNVSKWYEGLKRFPPGLLENLNPEMKVLSVAVDGEIACVKTRFVFPQNIYTDFLTLLKANGKWSIVTKTLSAKEIAPKETPKK